MFSLIFVFEPVRCYCAFVPRRVSSNLIHNLEIHQCKHTTLSRRRPLLPKLKFTKKWDRNYLSIDRIYENAIFHGKVVKPI